MWLLEFFVKCVEWLVFFKILLEFVIDVVMYSGDRDIMILLFCWLEFVFSLEFLLLRKSWEV